MKIFKIVIIFSRSISLLKKCITGTPGGLFLAFNVQQNEYMMRTTRAAGFMVYIHDQKASNKAMDELGFSTDYGTETQMALSIKNVRYYN